MTARNAKVLIIGWDAADWKVINPLLDRGEMPNLGRIVNHGVMGDIMTLEPVLSPMLWNSIATGKLADQHGILGFTEVDPRTGAVRPVCSTSRRVKALWNILTQEGYRANVVNWFGGHPAEPISGVTVSDTIARNFPEPGKRWPLIPGSVHPPELADTIAGLRMRVEEVDGETLQLFVPAAASIDQEKDSTLVSVARLIAETITVHTAATYVMENHPWDFMGVYYPSIDHFSHGFMHFHPPRQDWVSEAAFERLSGVVAGGYRLHDLLLGTLLRLAGDDATVLLLSDHGFHSDHLRSQFVPKIPAGPAEQHRPHGIFAMRGPGIRRDERIYGISLLDIAPTVLTLYGLPAGADMPGRVLVEAFEQPPKPHRIPSWEKVDGACGRHQSDSAMSAEDAGALLDQFVALGYIERPTVDQQSAADTCLRETKWNLARVYLSSGRPHLALPLLEEIACQAPERGDYALALAECQLSLGMHPEAEATALKAVEGAKDTAAHHLVSATIAFERHNTAECMEHLRAAEKAEPRAPGLPLRIGHAYLRLRRWDDAERHFLRAVDLDPHLAEAYESLALVRLRRKDYAPAADAALHSVGLQHDMRRSHVYLGIALLKMDRVDRAVQAFETALAFRPPLRTAHFWLARALNLLPGRQEDAIRHRALARTAAFERQEARDALARLRREAAGRAAERAQGRAAQPPPPPRASGETNGHENRQSLDFVLVSGLPRSGTSLMMQMLQAGGIPVFTDSERQPDEDNPEGYLEWEAVKQIRQKPEILRDAAGKVIKVISMLIPALPPIHRYKVLFMDRPVDEVFASQQKMIARRKASQPRQDAERMKAGLAAHRGAILDLMRSVHSFDVMVVDYPGLVREPEAWVPRIAEFLGAGVTLDREAMLAAVRPSLYRNRALPAS